MKQGSITNSFHQTKKPQVNSGFGQNPFDAKTGAGRSAVPSKSGTPIDFSVDAVAKVKAYNKAKQLAKDEDQHSTYSSSSNSKHAIEEIKVPQNP